MGLNLVSLSFCMLFCPLHITAFVYIHIFAANLDPTQFTSSQPPILSITAMAKENSAFVWMGFSRSNLSSTEDCQNCRKTYSLVNLAHSLSSAFGHFLPVFSSNKILLSSHSAVLIGGYLCACPLIIGPRSKCQNIIQFDPTRAAEACATEVNPPTTTRGQTQHPTAEALIAQNLTGTQKAHQVEILCCWLFTLLVIRNQQSRG